MRFGCLSFSPELIQARWVLDKFPSEDAPGSAQLALELGYDGKNIRRIAGLIRPDRGDLLPLMPGFLSELGVSTALPREEAAWVLARQIAKGISERRITPYEGARFIWHDIVNEVWPNQQHPLLAFVACASDYEDCESYTDRPNTRRQEIEQEITNEAKRLLGTPESRR
jgi:hypothetical protein